MLPGSRALGGNTARPALGSGNGDLERDCQATADLSIWAQSRSLASLPLLPPPPPCSANSNPISPSVPSPSWSLQTPQGFLLRFLNPRSSNPGSCEWKHSTAPLQIQVDVRGSIQQPPAVFCRAMQQSLQDRI